MVRFESVDLEYPTAELKAPEMAKLNIQLDNLFGPKDGVIYELLQTYKAQVVGFVKVMKHALGESKFGGQVPADTEIGIVPIRPAHFKDNGGNSLLGAGVTAKGDRFGISFDAEWKTLVEGTLHDDVGIIVFGLIDFYGNTNITARIDGIRVTVGQRTLLPIDVSNAVIKDNRNEVAIWNFNSIPIVPKEYFKIEVHSPDYNATSPTTGEIKLLGFAVGRGRFFKTNF